MATDRTTEWLDWQGVQAFATTAVKSRPRELSPSVDEDIRAAIDWLCRAQDKSVHGGISYGFSLRGGWKPPYRETSGYIVETLFEAAAALGDELLTERAVRVADWLISVQNPDGSIANPNYGPGGIVFDTGQVLFGFVEAHTRTGESRFLDAALRSARWLVSVADADGRWVTHEHFSTPHVYNSRTAWALLKLNERAPHDSFVRVARANLDWALSCQQPSGFFSNASFVQGKVPYTHNISYTICGLQESGWIVNDERYVLAARTCADSALQLLANGGFLPGQISPDGTSTARYVCLTGNCQLAIVWAKWFERTGDAKYRLASEQALSFVRARQSLTARHSGVRGAIAGSSPIWGRYAPLSFPNWATKFFVDAALQQRKWLS